MAGRHCVGWHAKDAFRAQRVAAYHLLWPPSPLPLSPVVAAEPASHLCVMSDLARLIIQHYEQHAIAWDADRRCGGWNDKHWHVRFIRRLPRPARVLDLGCGSGWPV